LYSRNGQQEHAIALFREITEKYPESTVNNSAIIGIGEVMSKQGKLTEAVALFDDFVRQHQADADLCAQALLMMAGCYQENGRNREAVQVYRQVIAHYPLTLPALDANVSLIRWYNSQGKAADARSQLQQFITTGNNLIVASKDRETVVTAGLLMQTYSALTQKRVRQPRCSHQLPASSPATRSLLPSTGASNR
jgi:lipopolysaccharide biosynthesis regulator YciM